MNPGYMGYGWTEVWCFVIPGVGLYYACTVRRIAMDYLVVAGSLDLDESLVGMTGEVFRLLFGFFFVILGSFRCREMGRTVVRLHTE